MSSAVRINNVPLNDNNRSSTPLIRYVRTYVLLPELASTGSRYGRQVGTYAITLRSNQAVAYSNSSRKFNNPIAIQVVQKRTSRCSAGRAFAGRTPSGQSSVQTQQGGSSDDRRPPRQRQSDATPSIEGPADWHDEADEDDYRPQFGDDDSELQSDTYARRESTVFQTASEVGERITLHMAEQNKENTNQDSQLADETRQPATRRDQRAASSEDQDAEVDDEDYFESLRAGSPARTTTTRKSRIQQNRTAKPGREYAQGDRNPRDRAVRRRRSPSSTSRAERESLSTSSVSDTPILQYKKVNRLAKRRVGEVVQPVQTRKPWSAEATQRLIEYIEDDRYQTSWAKIEHARDPLLQGRGQVALKDKARNIKFDYLKYVLSSLRCSLRRSDCGLQGVE